jgi:hypothetical protein
MGIKTFVKKTTVGTGKVLGSVFLGSVGTVSTIVEYVGAGSNNEVVEKIGHSLKSASFNGVRKLWGKESIEFDSSVADAGRQKGKQLQKEKAKILTQKEIEIERAERKIIELEKNGQVTKEYIVEQREKINNLKAKKRRSDEELSKDKTDIERPVKSFDHDTNVPLSIAIQRAESSPGVYILWLNGCVMKCGRSSQGGGVRKRLQEYYRLDYDNRAKQGDYWSVTAENREDIVVSWQCCPISKCHELEYKLFKKYGKGPWAQRAPESCDEDSWELII